MFYVKRMHIGNHKGHYKLEFKLTDRAVDREIVAILEKAGWERKVGPAPRAGLERGAQTLLDRLRKK